MQRKGIDFFETFSPTTKSTTIKPILAFATTQNQHLFQLEVNNAFLNRDLEEEVYMKISLGYNIQDVTMIYSMYKLHKSINGL